MKEVSDHIYIIDFFMNFHTVLFLATCESGCGEHGTCLTLAALYTFHGVHHTIGYNGWDANHMTACVCDYGKIISKISLSPLLMYNFHILGYTGSSCEMSM